MSRVLHLVQRILHGWDQLALASWTIFLALFTPLCLLNGMVGGALLCAGLGLLLTFFALRRWARGGKRWRGIFTWCFALEQGALLPLAAVLLALPPDGAWTRLPHTEWSDTVLEHTGDALIALCSGRDGAGIVFARPRGASRWHSLRYPGGHGWTLAWQPDERRLWVGPRAYGEVYSVTLDASARAAGVWRRFERPAGWLRRISVSRDRVFVIVRNRLYTLDPAQRRWRPASCGGVLCPDVVAGRDEHGRPLVLAVGRRWRESRDGGASFIDVTPNGPTPRLPRATLGAGWRYVYDGGLWGGSLHVAAPGQPFVERPLPVRDARIITVDPKDGAHAWLGSWGEGVHRTTDGGRSWQALGLRRVEVRALAVDWQAKVAYAASANMALHRGVWSRRF